MIGKAMCNPCFDPDAKPDADGRSAESLWSKQWVDAHRPPPLSRHLQRSHRKLRSEHVTEASIANALARVAQFGPDASVL